MFPLRHGAALLAACLALGSGTMAAAQDSFPAGYEALLMQGRLAEAEALAAARFAGDPGDSAAGFAAGLAEFLLAVENLGHGLYVYGLATSYSNPMAGLAVEGVPFLRLPLPENPAPEQVTYDGLRDLLDRFVSDLGAAEATLATVPPADFELSLRVPLIRLDFDRNGVAAPEESVGALFLAVTGVDFRSEGWAGWAGDLEDGRVRPFGLDQSEVPWLRAYCHLLMALAEFPLAHDWSEAFNGSFQGAFPNSRLPSSGLVDESRRMVETLGPEVEGYDWDRDEASWEDYQLWQQTPEGQAYMARDSALSAIEFSGIADLVAFVHLMHWPVVEPARMAGVRRHLLAMIELSRENWRSILAETDDNREWVPSPTQTVLFENLRITGDTVTAWHMFLDEFEAVLNGARLIPHWRVSAGRGINLRRMFEEPSTFDPVLIGQGSAILPYVEDGETVSAETVFTILSLMEGNPVGYFLWFN